MERSEAGPKVALVTGVAGQDGVYLSRLLLSKGYTVHGLDRGVESVSRERIELIRKQAEHAFFSHLGDIADAAAMASLIRAVRPDEIYNLAAQSSVQASFDNPSVTHQTNADGPQRLIQTILDSPRADQTKLFQASSSEIFGHGHSGFATEVSPFNPKNPYAEAKLRAHEYVVDARRRGLHASNGILFNHESPLRGPNFVTRKISIAVAAIQHGLQQQLALGDLDTRRDWGHAKEYVEAMWLMLQQQKASDYVLATGVPASPRDFVVAAFEQIGVNLVWRGEGIEEEGVCERSGRVLVKIDPRYFRPTSAGSPIGDASKARTQLGWRPQITWRELCAEMVQADLKDLERNR
jgi:GDPmannose 4,6-dehydratase